MIDKVFLYVVCCERSPHAVLVFRSLDEPGFEVPKGTVEDGESLLQAAFRELREEAGIEAARFVSHLGTTTWQDERQSFLILAAPPGLPDRFSHRVTGIGVDRRFFYRFRWLPIDADLPRQLVQGCGALAGKLRQAVRSAALRCDSATGSSPSSLGIDAEASGSPTG